MGHSPLKQPDTVAIVGAGLAGLSCARTLVQRGVAVQVFDKSRGVSGRMATRRADAQLQFDHGAQYFTARTPGFRRDLETWCQQGLAAQWRGRIVEVTAAGVREKTDQPERYVGVPGMTAIARQLSSALPLQLETEVQSLERTGSGWLLTGADGRRCGEFPRVVIALPAPQASVLVAAHTAARVVCEVPMTPCWSVLVAFSGRLEQASAVGHWDGAFVHDSPLAWVARDSSKPGRPAGADCWVLHASPQWSTQNLEREPAAVAAELLDAFSRVAACRLPESIYLTAHRWRYSAAATQIERQAYYDPQLGLALCGDWLAGGRVEGAYLSGLAAAQQLLGHAPPPTAG
jgi:renalase